MTSLAWSSAADSRSRYFRELRSLSQPRLEHNHCVTTTRAGQFDLRNASPQRFPGVARGGCVRDLLLWARTCRLRRDDGCTPDQVMRLFPESVAVGAQFGVWFRMAAIAIAISETESGDFHFNSSAESESPRTEHPRPRSREQSHHLIGRGIRRHVVIGRFAAKQ